MKWAELLITISPEYEDITAGLLNELTSGGVIISKDNAGRSVVRGYLPAADFFADNGGKIKKQINQLFENTGFSFEQAPEIRIREEEEWAQDWKSEFEAERVTEGIVICPEWQQDEYRLQEDEICLIIDPGMAFGTGKHPTTAMSLEALKSYIREGSTAVDLGTGSGILAIAAARMGAEEVLAVDIDSTACREAEKNILLNGVENRVCVVESDLLWGIEGLPWGSCDILSVNILLDVILRVLDDAVRLLRPGGILILSGITSGQGEEIYNSMRDLPFTVLEEKNREGWLSLALEKED